MVTIDKKHADSVAIVVVGYNRLAGIKRLLKSIEKADYPSEDIPLVISIDASGNKELYDFVKNYTWNHGTKYVNIQEERLGLKNHIFQCADLTEHFKAVIILEDDLYVSTQYYNYVLKALDVYGDNKNIAQIALYRNEMNGYVGLPYEPLQSGYDVLKIQATCSWGECWNKRMWQEFKKALPEITDDRIQKCDMPRQIKGWTRAWSKYFYTFIIENNKYVLYPNVSHTTNFNDAGGEHGSSGTFVQASLLQNPIDYRMPEEAKLTTYDVYYNNKSIYKSIGIDEDELCLDLYGFNDNIKGKRYILSSKYLSYGIVKSFGIEMRPLEMNIFQNIEGKGIFLYDTTISAQPKGKGYSKYLIDYFLKGFNFNLMTKESLRILVSKIKGKLHV